MWLEKLVKLSFFYQPHGQSASPPKDWSAPIYRDHTMNDGYGDYLENDTGSNSDDVLPESGPIIYGIAENKQHA